MHDLKYYSKFCQYFSDFSLARWLDDHKIDVKQQLQSYAKDLLMEALGIAGYLQSPQCQLADYYTNNDGWNTGCKYFTY